MKIDFIDLIDPEDNPIAVFAYFISACITLLFLMSFILEGFSPLTLRLFSLLLVFIFSLFLLYKFTCRYMFVPKNSFEDYLKYVETMKDDKSSEDYN